MDIQDSGTRGNRVQGNYVGTDAGGTAGLGNSGAGVGVYGGATNNVIGGDEPAQANVISANPIGVGIKDGGTTGNSVRGNLIGTDPTGTAQVGFVDEGVFIVGGATDNTIGPGNIISAGNFVGVSVYGAGTSRNVVLGNLIGTNKAGTTKPGGNQTYGVSIAGGATGNTVGGTAGGTGNLISGNILGVYISDAGTSGNAVLGNLIGTDLTGGATLGNDQYGVVITGGATANTVGGTAPGARNVISANRFADVSIGGSGTSGNSVLGNLIGTDVGGTAALSDNSAAGVEIDFGATQNTIGGTAAGAANVISAHQGEVAGIFGCGVQIDGTGTSDNLIVGNFIGTDISGTTALGNTTGVLIHGGAAANTVGGTAPGAGNIISGNGNGVEIDGASGNAVRGNLIGTDGSGAAPLGNSLDGVHIIGGATDNTIGGSAAGARNVISGNGF